MCASLEQGAATLCPPPPTPTPTPPHPTHLPTPPPALQVHLATLKTGERVVVKVQRPGLKELFDIDTKNIRWGHPA